MKTNKHGLSRDVPAPVKRTIRQQCGFGCIFCGSSIIDYEHIDPVFAEASFHDPAAIGLLCPTCHAKVTRGLMTKEQVRSARADPICLRTGFARAALELGPRSPLEIHLGNTIFRGIRDVFVVNGKPILAIDVPQEPGAPPTISALFYDRRGQSVAAITNNEWSGSSQTFDISTQGQRTWIRSALRKVDLCLRVNPPTSVRIEQICMRKDGVELSGNSQGGFTLATPTAAVSLPSDPRIVEHAELGIGVEGASVSFGRDEDFTFVDLTGASRVVPSVTTVENASLALVDPLDEGIGLPPGCPPGEKVMRISLEPGGSVSIRPDLSSSPRAPNSPARKPRKTGRNEPCPCGSGKKFKKCCLRRTGT